MRSCTFLILIVVLSYNARAQQVSGTVLDERQKPVAGASVDIRSANDSSTIKYTVSDEKGIFKFSNINPGNYFFHVSHVGYTDQRTPTFEVGENDALNLPAVQMIKSSGNLKEVVISSRKPVVEVRADRTILNVEGSVNAVGQDALELLRKSPGIMVDKDNNISLSGKTGIKVYIDGRLVPLNGSDLADYLKTIQSTEVSSIEIISNPSAKYDAAGNAGIINIRLKKNRSFGNNGSVTSGYSIGTHSNYNAGLSFNHRDSLFNWFGNYNYSNIANGWYLNIYRKQLDTLFDQHSTITPVTGTHTFKAGVDYFLNKKNTIGLMVNGSFSGYTTQTNSITPISYIPTGQPVKILQANNSSNGKRNNGNLNVNYHYIDTLGHELSMDADYGIYRISSDQLQPNDYFDPNGNPLYSNVYNMLAPTNIDIYSFKSDYDQNFKKGRLGIGVKTSYVTSRNDFREYDIYRYGKIIDTLHSNNFKYKENVNAVYANYNRPFNGWVIQAGLRMENTNARGVSNGFKPQNGRYVVYDSGFDRHYIDLFPSAAVTYNKNPMKQWTLTYSRRIDRPAYQDLNPFEFRLDEYTFQKGNTELQPQYTNSIGLTNVYKYKLTTTLNYSHVKDVFTQLVDTIDKSKAFLSKKNLATQDITSLNISYSFQYKWYSLFANVNTYYSLYKANFGTGRTVDVNVFAVNFFAQQTVSLGKGWTGEMSGFYSSPSVWQGTFKTHGIGNVDCGIQKTVLKNKGIVKASVSDVFHTLHWTATSEFGGQYLLATGGNESRQFKLYFTYKFGNGQVKVARQRQSGSEDENKRVGTQGGGLRNN